MKRLTDNALGTALARFADDRAEYRKVLLLFVYLLFVSSASTVGRTAADALFLTRFDASLLSKMYLPQAAALILAGIAFQRFGLRYRIDRLILAVIPALSALVAVSRAGIAASPGWVIPAIYVGYDVINFLMIVCFWQFATAVLDQRKVKRTIGLVGSGGLAGGILSGFGLKLLVPLTGTANLILLYAGLQLLALAAVTALIRRTGNRAETFAGAGKPGSPPASRPGVRQEEPGGMFRSVPHLKYVAVMSAALILVLTLVDYQFKLILREELQHEALAGFMGSFYGFAGLLALAVQVFVAGRVLTRFGVTTAILVFPAVLAAGSLGLLLLPVLAMAVFVKGSDKVVGDTINSSVNQLIMFPVPPQWRSRAKSFLDGIVRNGAKGLAAVFLLVMAPQLTSRGISCVVLGLLAVGIAAAIKVKGAYLRTLLAAMQPGSAKWDDAELDLMDPASLQLLTKALHSPDKRQVLYVLRVLDGLDGFDLQPHLPLLLEHEAPEVVLAALAVIERDRPASLEPELLALLDRSPDRRIRARAMIALAAYGKEEHLEGITAGLGDDDLELRCGAIAALVKHYGIEGMFRAVGVLKGLLESTREEERMAVAALFGSIGMRNFYKPLLPLLEDASVRVRRRALVSAGALRVPELVPALVPMLRHGGTRKEAIDALAAYGERELLPLLEPYLLQQEPPPHLPKVLERMGTAGAFAKLLAVYPSVSLEMRSRLLEAMGPMRRNLAPDEGMKADIEALILQEIHFYWDLTDRLAGLSGNPRYGEVAEAGGQLRLAARQRIFQLLGLIHDAAAIRAAYAKWTAGDAREQAGAMELIDQLTRGQVRLELAKLMEAGRELSEESRAAADLDEQLGWLSRQDDGWLSQLIRHAASPDAAGGMGEHMERIRLLRSYDLFRGLTSRELSDVARRLTPTAARRGETVIREQEEARRLYLIRSGTVSFYRQGRKTGERQAGGSFGKSGLLTRRERHAEVRAEEDCAFWCLDSEDFYEVMFDRSSIAIEMMRLLSGRLRSVLAQQRDTLASAPVRAIEPTAVPGGGVAAAEAEGRSDSLLHRILILQKIDLFAHLSEPDLVQLAQMMDEVAYAEGEDICRAGDYGDTLFGIIAGSVRIHRGDATLAVLGEGDYFGEMAIIDSGPRSADCTATSPTVLLQLHRDQVFSLCFQNMDVLRSMMQVMGDRLKGMIA